MSQSAQVFIEDTGVYLYDHYGAGDSHMGNIVRRALKREQRWDDPEYLTAIIFREMARGDIDGNESLGIGKKLYEDIELLITLNCAAQIITVKKCPGYSGKTAERYKQKYDIRWCTFENFKKSGTRTLRKVSNA